MDDDIGLPRATVMKMLRESLPSDTRVASEAADLLLRCCTEFIQLVASQALDAKASTMQPQHVIAALKELEFAELAEEIEAHQREWDAGERPKGRSKKTKADQMGLSEADQIAMQAALFAKAANAVQGTQPPQP